MGVQTPITVQQNTSEHWNATERQFKLIAGRRRVRASVEVGLTSIPALIYPAGFRNTMLLTDHAQRHANPAAELRAIEELQEQGYDEKAISQATGMAIGTIRNRLKLTSLCAELRDAFDVGDITLQIAEGLTKLSVEDQTSLAMQYVENGYLTSKDVRDMRRVSRETAMTEMDFDDGTGDTLPVNADSPNDQTANTRASLDQFITMMGTNPDSPQELAAVGIACVDTGRWEDVREILQRILDLQG
jgi:ParB/RepB/Spo0J family partition protein